MKYNPDIHHRCSIRLRNFDYSQAGAYFVTICTQNKECLFGEIRDGIMATNEAGSIVAQRWSRLTDKFTSVIIDEYVVMPNHFHGIIALVGADPSVCPARSVVEGMDVGADPCVCPPRRICPDSGTNKPGAHMGAPLHRIIQWFKTMTTNEYMRGVKEHGWSPFAGRLWQRNYYERVVRNEGELINIREYISQNPARWADDEENPGRR